MVNAMSDERRSAQPPAKAGLSARLRDLAARLCQRERSSDRIGLGRRSAREGLKAAGLRSPSWAGR
jgi:hypothetical protein